MSALSEQMLGSVPDLFEDQTGDAIVEKDQ